MTRAFLQMLHGPLIWISHFSLIYGAAGFGGAFGFSEHGIQLFCWIATLVAGTSILFLLWVGRENRASISSIGRTLAQLSLVAILLQALVLWIVPF